MASWEKGGEEKTVEWKGGGKKQEPVRNGGDGDLEGGQKGGGAPQGATAVVTVLRPALLLGIGLWSLLCRTGCSGPSGLSFFMG